MAAKVNGSNGISWKERTLRQSASMIAAEGICAVTSLAGLGAMQWVDRVAPNSTKWLRHNLGNYLVQPVLPAVEWADRMLSGLWQDSYNSRMKMNKADRSEVYAHALVNYGAAFSLGVGMKFLSRDWINRQLGAEMSKAHGIGVIAVDEGIHGATLAGMALLPRQMRPVQECMSHLLHNSGMSKDDADEMAGYTLYVEGSNAVGLAAALGTIGVVNWRSHVKNVKSALSHIHA